MKENNFKDKLEIQYRGFLLYIYDIQRMQCELKGLPKLATQITYSETNERFELGKPAFYLQGKPVWICLRGFPLSIETEDLQLESEIGKLKFRLPTSSEIEAKAKSLYAKMIFGKKMIDSSYYLITLLLCALVGLVVHLIDRITFTSQPEIPETVSNSTQLVNGTIQLIKLSRWLLW